MDNFSTKQIETILNMLRLNDLISFGLQMTFRFLDCSLASLGLRLAASGGVLIKKIFLNKLILKHCTILLLQLASKVLAYPLNPAQNEQNITYQQNL
ncbi:MAG: hypothetical protein ACL7BU_06525 [Candidatus Phlomobacter fragariae]